MMEPEAVAAHGRELAAAYTKCCARGIVAARERRRAKAMLADLKRRSLPIYSIRLSASGWACRGFTNPQRPEAP